MKLTMHRTLWSLAVGFLAQVALAILVWWGIPGVPTHRAAQGRLLEIWRDKLPSELGEPAMFVTLSGFGRTHTQVTWKKAPGEDDGLLGVNEGGWPFRSMSASYLSIRRNGTWVYERWATVEVPRAIRPSWHLANGQMAFATVPVRPLVIGTVLNTLVWGSGVFGVWTLVRWRRGRVRAQRGECLSCGYLMRSLERCPECGVVTSKVTG